MIHYSFTHCYKCYCLKCSAIRLKGSKSGNRRVRGVYIYIYIYIYIYTNSSSFSLPFQTKTFDHSMLYDGVVVNFSVLIISYSKQTASTEELNFEAGVWGYYGN